MYCMECHSQQISGDKTQTTFFTIKWYDGGPTTELSRSCYWSTKRAHSKSGYVLASHMVTCGDDSAWMMDHVKDMA